jgi:hypothetical protein
MIVVHVTHEAVEKIGGIGTVIAGLTTANAYAEAVERTILLGPLISTDMPINRRLGVGGHVVYSSLDAICPPEWREKFLAIERTYDVGIIYGRRQVEDACSGKTVDVEALILDVFHANVNRLNLFKAELFKKFRVPSHRFEDVWEYEEYVRLAEPGYEALKAIGCGDAQTVILAHEYMGMPTALKAVLGGSRNVRTVFYAHEVASVRPIVEKQPGHDTMFYNVMAAADGRDCEAVFPSVADSYKHALVKAARYCDRVFAVGDYIVRELEFLDRHFKTMGINLVYNGIPAERITLDRKLASKDLLRAYAEGLFGVRPDWVFSHVARPVLSKGIWRDLAVLHHLEPILAERRETVVYFMLGTLAGQRRRQDIRQMERVYGWPVGHEEGYPDLCQGEEVVGAMVEAFNGSHAAARAVFVNQWDWSRQVCGDRMPEEMTFADLRYGTDLEFGLSVYEPFGISQFEPLSFGALCLVSNVCGCMGFARRVAGGEVDGENIIEADFLQLPQEMDLPRLVSLSLAERDAVEAAEARRLAGLVSRRLVRDGDALARRIDSGYALASRMNWQHVVSEYFLPSLLGQAEGA